MSKLKKELDLIYKQEINVLAPKNCQTVKFNFVTYKTARLVGQMFDRASKIFDNSLICNIDPEILLKAANSLELKESMALNKMIEFDSKLNFTEEIEQKQKEDEEIVLKQYNDNFITIEGL